MDYPPCIVCGAESLPGCLTCYWHEPINAVAVELYNESGEYPNGVQIIARLLQDNARLWEAIEKACHCDEKIGWVCDVHDALAIKPSGG